MCKLGIQGLSFTEINNKYLDLTHVSSGQKTGLWKSAVNLGSIFHSAENKKNSKIYGEKVTAKSVEDKETLLIHPENFY